MRRPVAGDRLGEGYEIVRRDDFDGRYAVVRGGETMATFSSRRRAAAFVRELTGRERRRGRR